ncbi:MAG: PKD domain-containing protein [Thermoplasmatota archaeon]
MFLVQVLVISTLAMGPICDIDVEGSGSGSPPEEEPSRSGQYYDSLTGGKWVYDFSKRDPLSVSRNLSFEDGTAHLKERFELDHFDGGTVGDAPANWVESDPNEGDLVLDNTIFGASANSAHYTTVDGGEGYTVSKTMTAIGSSDTMEVRFSINIMEIFEATSNQGLACRLHYLGQKDGVEVRFHSNGTISTYGWDGSQNSENFIGTGFDTSTWHVVTIRLNMNLQDFDLWLGDQKAEEGAPFRSTAGGDALFINSISFITGSGNDGADFYIDDMYSTKNSIDSGSYTSPTISKTEEMRWQYLQVYPGENEDLLSLSLLNQSSMTPYLDYDDLPVPPNGRISVDQLPSSAQNFRIRVKFTRDGERRPTLDLVGASWRLKGHFFDPLFPGTGLIRSNLDHIKDGMSLSSTSPGVHSTSGSVISSEISLAPGRIWGDLLIGHEVVSGTAISVDVIGTTSETPIPGIPTSQNGTMDLFELGLSLDEEIRIKITLTGDGTATPIIRSISLLEPLNTPPFIRDISLGSGHVFRMANITMDVTFGDETDHPWEVDVVGEYSLPGSDEWLREYFGPASSNGSEVQLVFSPPYDAEVGEYKLRCSLTDRSGKVFRSEPIALMVKNRPVTRPVIEIEPAVPQTDNILRLRVIEDSLDPEEEIVRYRYHWYRNGVLIDPDDPDGPQPGWSPSNLTSRESYLNPGLTSKGDNISCRVVPTDLIEDGPEALAWVMINNSPPRGPDAPISLVLEEDTPVMIDLSGNFSDVDGDDIEFQWDAPDTMTVQEMGNKTIRIVPPKDFTGELIFNITASDGDSFVTEQIFLIYTPINDHPFIDPISDKTMEQGDSLDISVIWGDVESGEETVIEVELPDTWGDQGICMFSRENSTIRIEAENGNVGEHTFRITVMDREGNEFSISFNVSVINVNDPLEEVIILSPESHSEFEVGENITFAGEAIDPDIIHGQEISYLWFIITEEIGTERVIDHSFDEPGTYAITLEASDGTSSRSTKVVINITEGAGGGGGSIEEQDEDDKAISSTFIGIAAGVVLLLVLVVILILVFGRKKKGEEEPRETEVPRDEAPVPPEEHEASPVQEPVPEAEQAAFVHAPESETSEPEPPEEEQVDADPDILLPSEDDLIIPQNEPGGLQIPDIAMPETEASPREKEDPKDMEYYSPSRGSRS